MFEFRGVVFIDGEVAVITGWAFGDFIKGVGPVLNYYKLVYEDGSTQVLKSKFISKVAPDGRLACMRMVKVNSSWGLAGLQESKGPIPTQANESCLFLPD